MNRHTRTTQAHCAKRSNHPRWAIFPLLAALCLGLGCEDPVSMVQPPPPVVIDSPAQVVGALSRAYQTRDVSLFTSLLANAPDQNAEYLFLLSAPTDFGETQWEYAEEIRIHQRMFQPQNPPVGDPPVASELWLQELTITLTPREPFGERTDMYTPNGGSLDPAIWRATDASYTTYVFFDLAGTDYKVEGEANFVVIENLTKNVGDAGKFLLWIWEDIAQPWSIASDASLESEATTWGSVKGLYR